MIKLLDFNGLGGGPVATRTPDLYRVNVAASTSTHRPTRCYRRCLAQQDAISSPSKNKPSGRQNRGLRCIH